jgi:hypothetical protein
MLLPQWYNVLVLSAPFQTVPATYRESVNKLPHVSVDAQLAANILHSRGGILLGVI